MFRFLWDFIMLMLLIANLVILPVAIAFFNEENSNSWAVFNCINDSIFIIDILLNFRTGIPRQHMAVQVVLDPKVSTDITQPKLMFLVMVYGVVYGFITLNTIWIKTPKNVNVHKMSFTFKIRQLWISLILKKVLPNLSFVKYWTTTLVPTKNI